MPRSIPTETIDVDMLSRELDQLDALLHTLKKRLVVSSIKKTSSSSSYLALRSLRGILKGRMTEDPLQYQRRIRAESDARL